MTMMHRKRFFFLNQVGFDCNNSLTMKNANTQGKKAGMVDDYGDKLDFAQGCFFEKVCPKKFDIGLMNEKQTEIYLKKLLIKHAVDSEFQIFMNGPTVQTIEQQTLLLKFMYYSLLQFPAIKAADRFAKERTKILTLNLVFFHNSSLIEKLNEIMIAYPKYRIPQKRLSKL